MSAAQKYQYIFDDLHRATYIGIWILLILIGCIILFCFVRYTGPRYYTGKYGQKEDKHKLGAVLLVIVGIWFTLFIGIAIHQWHLEKHCGIAVGTITDKHWHSGKNSGWSFKYSFIAKGRNYIDDDVQGSSSLQDSVSAGNCYTVLYDTTNPDNTMMILGEQRNCDSL